MNLTETIDAAETISQSTGRSDRRLGSLLVGSGKLMPADTEKVMDLQRREGYRFGEAAHRLNLITERELLQTLQQQYGLPHDDSEVWRLGASLVAARFPQHPGTEQLRQLRTQLLIRWLRRNGSNGSGGKVLLVTSPGRHEGRSYVAGNLAVLFAQLGEKTLLVDADLRHPAQQRHFAIDDRVGLSAVLDGRAALDGSVLHAVPGIDHLRVLPAGAPPPNPLELLSRPALTDTLAALRRAFSVILIDAPPAVPYPDASVLGFNAGQAILVARRHHTRQADVLATLRQLGGNGTEFLGSVSNRF